ncbi:hypothetical protein C5167_011292 [Papaver somniferum]|uniref:FAE domain-containing protein n=1 Tax=Papaver somniferum TaxID=3469 RepID=A0A4Y7K6N9_PAPSO|nr:hypothetical protein C5167_011292 [Papaver somniferum]
MEVYHYEYGNHLSGGIPYPPMHLSGGPSPYFSGSVMGQGGMSGGMSSGMYQMPVIMIVFVWVCQWVMLLWVQGQGYFKTKILQESQSVSIFKVVMTRCATMTGLVRSPNQRTTSVFLNLVMKKLFNDKVKPYIPDFNLALDHFCIHAGGRAVIDELEKNLQKDEAGEPSLAYCFGTESGKIALTGEMERARGKCRTKSTAGCSQASYKEMPWNDRLIDIRRQARVPSPNHLISASEEGHHERHNSSQ